MITFPVTTCAGSVIHSEASDTNGCVMFFLMILTASEADGQIFPLSLTTSKMSVVPTPVSGSGPIVVKPVRSVTLDVLLWIVPC